MHVVVCFRWQIEFLGLLGVNVCCWVFYVAICIVGSFSWQCVLYVSAGNVCSWVFYVAICVICFRRQCVLMVFYVSMCVVGTFRWQCVLMGLLGGNVCC